MKHSNKDLILVFLSLAHLAGMSFFFLYYHAFNGFEVLALVTAHIFLICTNYQCIAHNHIHNPFFRSQWQNTLFSCVNSISLGMPQSLYQIHHLNHHRYNNDRKDENGKTQDWSSIYRYSDTAQPEPALRYALLSLLRTNFTELYREASRKGKKRQTWAEVTLLITVLLVFAMLAGQTYAAIAVFVASTLIGQAAAFLENYAEHFRAIPGDRQRDSVSCYSPIYNVLWFNNGYHQEHHSFPAIHWTKISDYRSRLPKEDRRRVVRGCHIVGLVTVQPLPFGYETSKSTALRFPDAH